MARKRMIEPELWTDEQVSNLSRDARLLFIGLISNADDEGRLKGTPRYLKAVIFPYDDIGASLIDSWLNEVISQNLVIRYNVNGDEYLVLPSFLKHQTINRPSPSRLPEPIFTEGSLNTHGVLSEDSHLKEKKRKEENIKEKNKEKNIVSLKKTYGEFQNVLLTDEEYQKLKDRLGADVSRYIEDLSRYLEQHKRKHYDSHYATILAWQRREKEKHGTNRNPRDLPKTYTRPSNDE
jgi:hypothetical protein